MTGTNHLFDDLIGWCGNNHFLSAACEQGAGFLLAWAFGCLCFCAIARFAMQGFGQLSRWHFALLFASATWSFFLAVFAVKWSAFSLALATLQVTLIVWIFFAPISAVVGIPCLLIYLFKRPVLQIRTVYFLASSNLVLSYLYAVLINRAFGSS